MRDLYEAVWEDAPDDPEPWQWPRRKRLLERRASERGLSASSSWLDLGCGAGRFTTLLPGGIGVEIAQAAIDRARRAHPDGDFRLWAPAEPLPVEDASVDLVWCSEVIEHVPDVAPFVSEIRRVLRPGGAVLLTTPDHPRVRRTLIAVARFDAHFDPRGQHVRFFTRRSLQALLDDLGFEDVRLGPRRTLPATIVAEATKPGARARPR